LRLRPPTPGLVGSPHVHSSCLAPVSFAGMSTYLRLQAPRAFFRPGFCPLQVCINGYLSPKKSGSPTGSRPRSFCYSLVCIATPVVVACAQASRPVIQAAAAYSKKPKKQEKSSFPGKIRFQYDILYKFLQMAGGFPKAPALRAACFARCCTAPLCSLICHRVHLLPLPSLSLFLPRRSQPCCRALQFYIDPMPALVVCFSSLRDSRT
jgi:hypothetical protein